MDGGPLSINRTEEGLEGKVSTVPFKVEPVEEDGERQPLLGNRERQVKEKTKLKPWKWKWRKWLLVCVLWLAQMFMASAYSLIAPFFPTTVLTDLS